MGQLLTVKYWGVYKIIKAEILKVSEKDIIPCKADNGSQNIHDNLQCPIGHVSFIPFLKDKYWIFRENNIFYSCGICLLT